VTVPTATLQRVCRELLVEIGEDPEREGLVRTPERFAKMIKDVTSGYTQDLNKILNNAIFHEDSSQMVVVKKIPFHSLCEHHILPFYGHAHVAYIPNGKIIGLSKIPRIVHMFARRLQVQERLTTQIANAIQEVLEPIGVACMVESVHMCAMMRGVRTHSSSMVTSVMLGEFRENHMTRNEFLSLVNTRD